jgi:hypothetical protein
MHLEQEERAKSGKSPLHIKAVENAKNGRGTLEIEPAMWKSGLFSGKVALLTRHLRPIRVVNWTLLLVQLWAPRLHLTAAGL